MGLSVLARNLDFILRVQKSILGVGAGEIKYLQNHFHLVRTYEELLGL